MRITTTLDEEAQALTVHIEGRVELLGLDPVPRAVAGVLAGALAEVAEIRRLARSVPELDRFDDDPALDVYYEALAEPFGDAAHWGGCWREHDECALVRAKQALEADQSTALHQTLLYVVEASISDHADGRCSAGPRCAAVRAARRFLEENQPALVAGSTS